MGSSMNKNEWYQIGEGIKNQVQHAIDTNDFSQLSKTISETVNLAANDVGKSLNDVGKSINDIGKSLNDVVNEAAGSFQQGLQQSSAYTYRNQNNRTNTKGTEQRTSSKRQKWERYNGSVRYGKPNLRPDPKLFNNMPRGSVSGLVWMVLGFGAMGISCLAAVQGALGVLTGIGSVTTLALPITTAAAGGVLGTYGTGVTRRVERFRRYVDIVKDKLYCSIEDMADKTGKSKRYVRRDLKRMMQKGMFLQAHLDKKETCFIASDAMYEQYMLTQRQYEQTQIESKTDSKQQLEAENVKTEVADAVDSRAARILAEGREYIRVIRKCNDEIPGEEMSGKLDKLELLVTRIFARVEEEPEVAPELQKMLSYYLPTTQKLLEAYRDLDKQDVDVKNISETKREIEATVDTINTAFEKFLDELFRDKAWDIQSDITVLNTMLKQDGYLKADFDKGKGSKR